MQTNTKLFGKLLDRFLIVVLIALGIYEDVFANFTIRLGIDSLQDNNTKLVLSTDDLELVPYSYDWIRLDVVIVGAGAPTLSVRFQNLSLRQYTFISMDGYYLAQPADITKILADIYAHDGTSLDTSIKAMNANTFGPETLGSSVSLTLGIVTKITAISKIAGQDQYDITWDSIPGGVYVIETTTELTAVNWTILSNNYNASKESYTARVDSAPEESNRFWRVRRTK